MQQPAFSVRKACECVGAALVIFALAFQLYLIIAAVPETGLSYTAEVVRFFSYMTVLSNIFVACCFVFQLIARGSRIGKFFRQPAVLAAVCLYIFIVGLLNHLLLSHLSDFTGGQLLCDRLLHYVIPIVYVAYWIFLSDKSLLSYNTVFIWLIFPLLYVIYAMIRGAITNLYPYPFLDVPLYGLNAVLINMAVITASYAVGAVALVFINNSITKSAGLLKEI